MTGDSEARARWEKGPPTPPGGSPVGSRPRRPLQVWVRQAVLDHVRTESKVGMANREGLL